MGATGSQSQKHNTTEMNTSLTTRPVKYHQLPPVSVTYLEDSNILQEHKLNINKHIAFQNNTKKTYEKETIYSSEWTSTQEVEYITSMCRPD